MSSSTSRLARCRCQTTATSHHPNPHRPARHTCDQQHISTTNPDSIHIHTHTYTQPPTTTPTLLFYATLCCVPSPVSPIEPKHTSPICTSCLPPSSTPLRCALPVCSAYTTTRQQTHTPDGLVITARNNGLAVLHTTSTAVTHKKQQHPTHNQQPTHITATKRQRSTAENATDLTTSLWPSRVLVFAPVATSHNLTHTQHPRLLMLSHV